MKRSSWLVPGVLVSLAALVSAPGCSGGSKTAEPTTLPSASRPPRPPTRVRTEQSREDPLEVDGRTERLNTLGGPLERRRLPSNEEPLDIPETDLPADRDGAAPAGARAPGAERAEDDDEEIPDDLQRGGPDPDATSETGTGSAGARGTQPGAATRNESTAGASTTGGFIPIDVPPSAGATKSAAGNGSSKAKGTTASGARRSAAQTSAGTSRGGAGTGSSAGREKAAGKSDTRQGSSSRPTGGDDDTGAGSANAAEGEAGGQSQSGAGGANTGQGSGTGGGATGGTSGSGTGGAAGGGATGGAGR